MPLYLNQTTVQDFSLKFHSQVLTMYQMEGEKALVSFGSQWKTRKGLPSVQIFATWEH